MAACGRVPTHPSYFREPHRINLSFSPGHWKKRCMILRLYALTKAPTRRWKRLDSFAPYFSSSPFLWLLLLLVFVSLFFFFFFLFLSHHPFPFTRGNDLFLACRFDSSRSFFHRNATFDASRSRWSFDAKSALWTINAKTRCWIAEPWSLKTARVCASIALFFFAQLYQRSYLIVICFSQF